MPITPGGNIRKKIGPLKGRLEGTVTQADALIGEPIQANLPAGEYEPLRFASHQLLLRIERRLNTLEELDKQYCQVVSALPDEDPEQEHYAETAEGADGYLQLVENAKDMIDSLKARLAGIERAELRVERAEQAASVTAGSLNNSVVSAIDNNVTVEGLQELHAKMPKLPLPSFNGDVSEWLEFWGQFKKTVHEKNLNLQDKFSYLKRYLTGNAAAVVQGLSVTEENYNTAIDLLKSRYGDEEVLKAILYSQWESLTAVTNHTNYPAIQNLTDSVQKIVRQLASLSDDCDSNSLAIQQYLMKLPHVLRLELENERGKGSNPQNFTMTSLFNAVNRWLHVRLKVFQNSDTRTHHPTQPKSVVQKRDSIQENSTSAIASDASPKTPCVYCGDLHYNDRCMKVSTHDQRKKRLMELKRCFLCLQIGHGGKSCPNRNKVFCYHCKKQGSHTRSLCANKFGTAFKPAHPPAPSFAVNNISVGSGTVTNNDITLLAPDEYAMFQTATTMVQKPGSNVMAQCRILLDSASNRTYILSSLAKRLNLTSKANMELNVKTFGSGEETMKMNTQVAEVEIFLKDGNTKCLTVNIADSITGSMTREQLSEADVQFLYKYPNESFADVLPVKADVICPDILIGQAYFWDFVQSGPSHEKLPSGLRMLPTTLGLMLGGSAPLVSSAIPVCTNVPSFFSLSSCCTDTVLISGDTSELLSKESVLKDFWSLEMMGITESPVADEGTVAMEKFEKDIVLEDNRYQVRWPWKSSNPKLPDNYSLALGRLRSLSRRLTSDPNLQKQYTDNINEQVKNGIIEKVTPESETGPIHHYLPHHPVVKETSNTTKVRIVYDASARLHKNAKSLNDCLLPGPNLIADLCGILLRFRVPKIAILADIEKAFLNVGLQLVDRDACRFLWFEDPTKQTVENNVAIYRFKRVPFGVVSSPFLLEAVLNYHLKQKDTYLNKEIRENVYVDNVFLPADSVEEACEKYKQAKGYLAEVSLNLREWVSNSKEFTDMLPDTDMVKEDKVKILGMMWTLKNDTLSLHCPETFSNSVRLTKRKLLQMVASVFDPMGFWTPVTHYGKVLFQKTWIENLSWDEPLPEPFVQEWLTAVKHMELLNSPIHRKLQRASTDGSCRHQLIAFTDASLVAYGASLYLKTTTSTESCSELIFSKMRLTPLNQSKKKAKEISLPRLELLGVLIGVRCLKYVSEQLRLPLDELRLYSDSQCVLHWIHSSKPLKPFVANRVNEIHQLPKVKFQYVPTGENPADLLTHGVPSEILIQSKLWWHGPDWLKLDESKWPKMSLPEVPPTVFGEFEEEFTRNEHILNSLTTPVEAMFPFQMLPERFSSVNKLFRVTVLALRFMRRLSRKFLLGTASVLQKISSSAAGPISAIEIEVAENLWIKRVQQKAYPEVIHALKTKKPNILQKQFGLFLDNEGLIRCAGRFELSEKFAQKNFPWLLPREGHFCKLLVEHAHLQVLHGRVNHTLAELRKKIWIPKGRMFVQQVLRQCGVCKRFGGGPFQLPQFGPLTKERIEPYTPPFRFTVLDYFGPIHTKDEEYGGKVWVCLFTCLVVRAVHLEIVYDMSTTEFLAAFQRFCCAQAKIPRKIISDNAAQFKLADLALQALWKKLAATPEIAQELADKRITWVFIPALSPWQGGLYERLVGTVKSALRKSIGRKLLKPQQLVTVLCQISQMVNSRPITYLASELNDIRALCPNDFLHPGHDSSLPQFLTSGNYDQGDPEYFPKESSAGQVIRSWSKLQSIMDEFWLLWKLNYLTTLQERKDYKHPTGRVNQKHTPKVGEVVVIKEEGVPRGLWKLARITKLNYSRDKEVRSVEVLTPNHKLLTRPLSLLYPLEIATDETEVNCEDDQKESNPEELERKIRPSRTAAEKCKIQLKKMIDDDVLIIFSLGNVMNAVHD